MEFAQQHRFIFYADKVNFQQIPIIPHIQPTLTNSSPASSWNSLSHFHSSLVYSLHSCNSSHPAIFTNCLFIFLNHVVHQQKCSFSVARNPCLEHGQWLQDSKPPCTCTRMSDQPADFPGIPWLWLSTRHVRSSDSSSAYCRDPEVTTRPGVCHMDITFFIIHSFY